MKLRLHWSEKYEMVREYPSFELDSQKFPELELEMVQVHNAGSISQRDTALGSLEYKMQHTKTGERGETIFQMVAPHSDFTAAQTHPLTEDIGGLVLSEEK